MNIQPPSGDLPIQTMILRLPESHDLTRHSLFEWLDSTLVEMNWRSDIFLLDNDPAGEIERFTEIIGIIGEYLTREKLAVIYVHPFIRMQACTEAALNQWETVLNLTLGFQQEAYEQQDEVRMLILPIIQPPEAAAEEDILFIADFFRTRLAKPSFYFISNSPLDPQTVLEKELRVYVEPKGSAAEDIVFQLGINHVFDTILKRVESGRMDLLSPCGRHIVVDGEDVASFPCFARWEEKRPSKSTEPPDNPPCIECISGSCVSMKVNLAANAKQGEGRQAGMELALALSSAGRHREASGLAWMVFQLSATDPDKSAALLQQALCHLNLMEWRQADQALEKGMTCTDDPGLFAYHRGVVRFAQQDFSGAIRFFTQALERAPTAISGDDIRFNLGTSYVNLGQFAAARSIFDGMEQTSPPVRFYQGICDFNEGYMDRALGRFREALTLGPAPEDLARVHFYVASCLKELAHFDEAIVELKKAVNEDPTDYMNYNLLGFCHFQLKQHELAIEAFHKAIEINPGSAIDYASIGSNLRELGRYQDAIAMYHMALSLDPGLGFAKENIAKLKQLLEQ